MQKTDYLRNIQMIQCKKQYFDSLNFLSDLHGVFLVLFLFFILLHPALSNAKTNIIFDSDFSTDVDDVGALAILHRLADLGEIRILGMTSNTSNPTSPAAMDVINHYYERPDIPIGVWKGAELDHYSGYTDSIVAEFPHDLGLTKDVPDATIVFRQILVKVPDSSVVIVAVGFPVNLVELINSPADTISPLSGMELVKQKVKRVDFMGANYPEGLGYNFEKAGPAAHDFLRDWPTRIDFPMNGGTLAPVGGVLSANDSLVRVSPVAKAFLLHTGKGNNRPSWDLIPVYYAARGTDNIWYVLEEGCSFSDSSGYNTWSAGTCGHYPVLKKSDVPHSVIAGIFDEMLLAPPVPAAEKPDFNEIWPPVGLRTPGNKSDIRMFNNSQGLTINYTLESVSDMKIDIFNLYGNLIATVQNGCQETGTYKIVWSGTSIQKKHVPKGVYVVHMHKNGVTKAHKFFKHW
ncbi:MAG: hypothetical protein HQK83_19155 [Fibrobacteria bacterium]|nr:hypothetical protein [Fibrobacteria bacterium]